MSNNLQQTLKKRYERIIEHTNKIWQLEKVKYDVRSNLVKQQENLSSAKKASASYAMSRTKNNLSMAASIADNQKSIDKSKEELDKIKEKQLVYLDKIKSILEL